MKKLYEILITIALLTSCSTSTEPTMSKKENEPVVVRTPWGQEVVPDLWTYLDMTIYDKLDTSQSWSDGDRLDFGRMTFYAIWTPGHTPGLTCYLLKHKNKQILFSEDIALHNGRYAWMGHPYADWDQYLKSLEKLSNFTLNGKPIKYDLLLPGHGVVELEGAMRSVKETTKLVRHIVDRRKKGEAVTWIKPYQWNWENKVIYKK